MKRRLIAALAALLVITLLASCGDPGAFSDEECLSDDVKRSEDSTLTFHYADGAVESPLAYTNYIIGATGFALKQLRARVVALIIQSMIRQKVTIQTRSNFCTTFTMSSTNNPTNQICESIAQF